MAKHPTQVANTWPAPTRQEPKEAWQALNPPCCSQKACPRHCRRAGGHCVAPAGISIRGSWETAPQSGRRGIEQEARFPRTCGAAYITNIRQAGLGPSSPRGLAPPTDSMATTQTLPSTSPTRIFAPYGQKTAPPKRRGEAQGSSKDRVRRTFVRGRSSANSGPMAARGPPPTGKRPHLFGGLTIP